MPSLRLPADRYDQRLVEYLGFINSGIYAPVWGPGTVRTHWELRAMNQLRISRDEISLALHRPLDDEEWADIRAGVGPDSAIKDLSDGEFVVLPKP